MNNKILIDKDLFVQITASLQNYADLLLKASETLPGAADLLSTRDYVIGQHERAKMAIDGQDQLVFIDASSTPDVEWKVPDLEATEEQPDPDLVGIYEKALADLHDHFGFEESYVVCPIDLNMDMVWKVSGDGLHYAKKIEDFETGDCYSDDIFRSRFYEKSVWKGDRFTMVFSDPGVDGMRWFRIFDNSKEIADEIWAGI